jgi:WD40 repeat protein
VVIWDIEAQETVGGDHSHDGEISALAWSPDGTQVVTGQVDSSTLKIWSLSGDKRQLTVPGTGSVRSLAWHPGGDRIAVVDDQGNVRVLDLGSGAVRAQLTAGANGLADAPLAWHPGPDSVNDLLVVAGEDGMVLRWAHGRTPAPGLYPQADEVLELAAPPRAFAWSNDGTRLAACGGGSVRLWDSELEQAPERPAGRRAGGSEIAAARWTPNDRYLLTALTDNSRLTDEFVGVALWDLATRQQVRSWTDLSGEFEPCRGIALSNGGTRVACLRGGQLPAIRKLSRI